MLSSKKGAEGMIWILVVAIALLVFLFIYSGVFTKLLGKQARGIETQIDVVNKGDTDKDGNPDITDPCPNEPDDNCINQQQKS